MANNIRQLLEVAGFREEATLDGSDHLGGFSIGEHNGKITISYSFAETGDSGWAWHGATSDPDHPHYNWHVLKDKVDAIMTGAYTAFLQAAGYTVTVTPDTHNNPPEITVIDGPTAGIAQHPDQEPRGQ